MTEYFLAKDLFSLAEDQRMNDAGEDNFAQEFEQVVLAYKRAVFPETMQ